MRRIFKTAAVLPATAAIVILTAGAAQASTRAMPTASPTRASLLGAFHLTKTDASGTKTEGLLFCGEVQHGSGPLSVVGYGSVADPTRACRELQAANGDIKKLMVHPTWLPLSTDAPVTVMADGSWRGIGDERYCRTFRNDSWATKFTGDVFRF